MICFEVTINDASKIVAGLENISVLSAILTYRAADPEYSEELNLALGGLAYMDEDSYEHLDWVKRSVQVGDMITIRIVESDQATLPIRRERDDPDFVAQQKRRYYNKLKEEYGEA
jgi:flagellar basal body L-ring protein FlgH